ncbi:MAG: hypothetical protein NTX85_02150 [Candidatus Nomurabacteria bacterium]|nr:hypothetical protein [Candidatus Nomurabacteria bacterium]
MEYKINSLINKPDKQNENIPTGEIQESSSFLVDADYIESIKSASGGDLEVLDYLVNIKTSELIDAKKSGKITTAELLDQRKILDEVVNFKDLSSFKQKELIDAFSFEGDENARKELLSFISNKESITNKGANQKGVYDLPNNKIVKIVSAGNYPFELPMVKLTKDLEGENVIKTYDVFTANDFTYVVQDKAVGKDVHEYSQHEIDGISQDHYDNLVQLINMYASHGVGTDPSKISNLFYDPQKGFSVIDLGAATYQRGVDYHINGYFTNNLARHKIDESINKFGEYKLKPILPTLNDKLKKLNL